MSSRFGSAAARSASTVTPATDLMPPAQRRRLQTCFERGNKAAKDGDFDYAHDMYSECVVRDPGNLVYVESMLSNLQKKYQNNKKGARLKGFGGKGGLKRAIAAEDWGEILSLGLDQLKVNPWDVTTLRAMAGACEALGFNEVELRYLKNALDANHKNIDVNRHCARSLARMGQFDQAIACWHRVEELNRDDAEAPKMISELTVQKTRCAGGLSEEFDRQPTNSATSKKVNPPPASSPPTSTPRDTVTANVSDATRAAATLSDRGGPLPPTTEPISADQRRLQLAAAMSNDPTCLANYLELAELHSAEGNWTGAEEVLRGALEASGNDLKIREQWENSLLRGKQAQLAVAERRAAAQQTEEAHELAKRLKADLNRLEIEILAERTQRYPQHLGYKFDVGVRLKRAGNYAEAVRYLEPTLADARWTGRAALEIGECRQQLRQYSAAMASYEQAVEVFTPIEPTGDRPGIDLPPPASAARDAATLPRPAVSGGESTADIDRWKLALYRAGVLAMGLKDHQRALRYLERLAQSDSTYRDLASRLDTLRKIGDT